MYAYMPQICPAEVLRGAFLIFARKNSCKTTIFLYMNDLQMDTLAL